MDEQEIRGRLEQLEKAVASLHDTVYGPRNAAAPVPMPVEAWPRVVEHRGVRIMLNAPIHPKWLPPMSANVFGSYGSHVADPSNAPPGYPNRSPGGWPLHYGGVAWDSLRNCWSGTPMGPGAITNAGIQFPSEAAAEQWTDARLAQQPDPAWSAYRPGR